MVITHKDLPRFQRRLNAEPHFQCGHKCGPNCAVHDGWWTQPVTLEVPTGELAKDGLTTLAIVGRTEPEYAELSGEEGFKAHGLEGKARIRKPLFNALMNLRDLIPEYRGRIVMD